MGELDGRLIILTGGAGGIARETAPLLLAQGAELLLIDVDRGRLDEARRALEATGRVEVAISRLESPAACEAALAGIARPVYALVHLAGVFEPDALDAASRPIWDRTLAVNLTNAFDIAAAVQPRLDAHEVCRMLFVSSLAFRAAPSTTSPTPRPRAASSGWSGLWRGGWRPGCWSTALRPASS